jgi:hypothetical protein
MKVESHPTQTVAQTASRPPAITVAALAQAKALPVEFLQELGLHDLPSGGVGIPYYDITGMKLALKQRTALKAGEGSYWPKGQSLTAYGQWRLDDARKHGSLILVEGESDCWALWHHGYSALGIPGASSARTLEAEHLECVEKVYVHREPDNGGATFLQGMVRRLRDLGFRGAISELRMPDGIKDPADLQVADAESFRERFEAALQAARPVASPGAETRQRHLPDLPDLPDGGEEGTEPWPAEPIPLTDEISVETFPIWVFPPALGTLIHECSAALNCPPDFVGVTMLVVAGGMIGAARSLLVKPNYFEPAALYAALVGGPGSAKSPVLKLLMRPVINKQAQLCQQYTTLRDDYEQQLAAYEAQEKQAAKQPEPEPAPLPAKPRKPTLQRLWTEDTTVEALAKILQENPRGLLLKRDELAAWVGSMNQYKGGRGSDRQFFLSCWSNEAASVDRKGNPDHLPISIPYPVLCVVGGIQPDVLQQLRNPYQHEDGFLERLLFAYPDPRPMALWSEAGVRDETLAVWTAALDELSLLDMAQNAQGLWVPVTCRFSDPAASLWEKFYNAHVTELSGANFPHQLVAYWSKLRAYAARLSLILQLLRAVCDGSHQEFVDAQSVEGAWALIRYFKTTFRRVCGRLKADPDIEKACRVRDWIVREQRAIFKPWEVHKDIRNETDFRCVGDMDRPLALLVDHHYVRRLESPYKGKGRPPAPSFQVHPMLWEDHQENRVNRENASAPSPSLLLADHRENRVNREKSGGGCLPDSPDSRSGAEPGSAHAWEEGEL